MKLREDIAELPDGRETIYGVVTFGECVGVLPFVDEDTVILVRQYRYVFGENQRWEMPTGGMQRARMQKARPYASCRRKWASRRSGSST